MNMRKVLMGMMLSITVFLGSALVAAPAKQDIKKGTQVKKPTKKTTKKRVVKKGQQRRGVKGVQQRKGGRVVRRGGPVKPGSATTGTAVALSKESVESLKEAQEQENIATLGIAQQTPEEYWKQNKVMEWDEPLTEDKTEPNPMGYQAFKDEPTKGEGAFNLETGEDVVTIEGQVKERPTKITLDTPLLSAPQ